MEGMRETIDKMFYDTHVVKPGETVIMFVAAHSKEQREEEPDTTNARYGIVRSHPFLLLSVGVRLIGKTQSEKDLLLDYLSVQLVLNDRIVFEAVGMLSYPLSVPIAIPRNTQLYAVVRASEKLPYPVAARIHLLGQQERDVV